MELGILNEIDLAFFIHNGQDPQRSGQEFLKRGVFLAGKKYGIAFFGSFLINAFVIDKRFLDIPFEALTVRRERRNTCRPGGPGP